MENCKREGIGSTDLGLAKQEDNLKQQDEYHKGE